MRKSISGIWKLPKKSASYSSISRAAEIINALSGGSLRLTDIAKKLNTSYSTTHRLLKALDVTGFVAQDPITRRYLLGHFIVSLTAGVIDTYQILVICAKDEMNYLRDKTGETVALMIRLGTERMILKELASKQEIRFALGNGHIAPIHIGADGIVLLSLLAENELETLLKSMKHANMTTNTVIDKGALRKEVAKAAKQGYETSVSSVVPGAACLAVPIKGYQLPVALSIYGPENRFPHAMKCLEDAKECADRISGKLKEMTR